MKATLYEALGIAPNAADEEVRAALRRLIRKYYAKTRDGQGNVEEALRFINHASRILGDTERRQRYDQELARSAAASEERIANVATQMVADAREQTDVGHDVAQGSPVEPAGDADAALEQVLDNALSNDAPDDREHHHPGLTERMASFGRSSLVRSPIVTLSLCALFGLFIAASIVFVTPDDTIGVAKQVLVWLTAFLVAVTLVYGGVHAFAHFRRRGGDPVSGIVPQTDLAILNWRREKSVFLGTNQPQEDASWIFQLRMAELERAKSGRTSEPCPWHRLAARLFDYAIWGLVLALLLSELRTAEAIPAALAYWIGHPLIAPIAITTSWIPVEALLITALGTTPGKWLFGVYVQFSISDAYARRDTAAQFMRGLRRAFRVWWTGVGCGVPLLAPLLVAVAYEKLERRQETDWDFALDCLVTHGPSGFMNSATGVCGLAAMLWLYGVAWHQPLTDSIVWARTAIGDAIPTSALRNGLTVDAGKIANVQLPAIPLTGRASPDRATQSTESGPVDPELDAQLGERRARIVLLKTEGVRMLQSGNYHRASELCRGWANLDLANADAWRCLGQALQGQGYHQEAINALRKAKQYDPTDRTIDAAIDKSQQGIVSDFIARYRR